MNTFRIKEKAKAVAKVEVINSILDDVTTMQLSKAQILALLNGYKIGLTSVIGWYEDKETEASNGEVLS
jgi:hypothetical protein